MLKARHQAGQRAWSTRIPREAERAFFFYATVVMFLVYAFFRLFGS